MPNYSFLALIVSKVILIRIDRHGETIKVAFLYFFLNPKRHLMQCSILSIEIVLLIIPSFYCSRCSFRCKGWVLYIKTKSLITGLDKIEFLQSHENLEIYKKSFEIIENYFGSEEEDGRLAPTVSSTTEQYQFNADQAVPMGGFQF